MLSQHIVDRRRHASRGESADKRFTCASVCGLNRPVGQFLNSFMSMQMLTAARCFSLLHAEAEFLFKANLTTTALPKLPPNTNELNVAGSRLVRRDSPRFSATDKHASSNIGSITKAQPKIFWDTIYFYTASATVGNQSSIVPRETSHHERDGLMTTCGCLFGIVCLNKTRALERCRREKKRALSTRVEIFANGGSID